MNYRYAITLRVEVAGDGQHADGNGASATKLRLEELLEADERVLEVRATWPHYIGPVKVGGRK